MPAFTTGKLAWRWSILADALFPAFNHNCGISRTEFDLDRAILLFCSMPLEGVQELASFMKEFAAQHA